MCFVKRITRNARFIFWVRFFPSSRFVIIRFFRICIDLSTTPFPVCILGVQYSGSMLRSLQNCLYSFEIKDPPLSDSCFLGIPYRIKLLVKKFITSFASHVLQIFTVGHLLNLSTATGICISLFKFLLCYFPVKSICIS